MKNAPAILAALFLVGCSGQEVSAESATRSSIVTPNGATIGSTGFATILNAPPAPFIPTEPGPPPPPTPEQRAAQEQFARAGRFQAEVMGEAHSIANRLRVQEKDNFVDLYFENEGDPKVVFRFLRDATGTLARYTRHPRFFAETARFSDAQLVAAMDFMLATFRDDRVIAGGGTGNKENRAVIEINVTEPEFRALVARKGVTIPHAVELRFTAVQPATALNRSLPPRIAPLIRHFQRDDRPIGLLHSINSSAQIVLEDGCFRVAGGDHAGALVIFPLGAQLFIDRGGYLAFGEGEVPGYGRVGEELIFPGSIEQVSAEELVKPLRDACGAGKVIKVTAMRSAAALRAQEAAKDNAWALRTFREQYGLSDTQARQALERCKARWNASVCIMSPPPPPPPGGPDCPPGTRATYGLCRTPEGFVRPIPKWIQELIAPH